MEPTRDFSLTENELHNLQQTINQAEKEANNNHRPSPTGTRRLLAELRSLSRTALDPSALGSADFPFSITPLPDSSSSHSIREFLAKFPGPPSTPYSGGIFHLRLSVPASYPTQPPRVWFATKTYHPNVQQPGGEVCAHGLGVDWNAAAWELRTVVLAVASLLAAPDLMDPLLAEVAREYLTDRAAFERTAREWTVRYAGAGGLGFPGEGGEGGGCNTMTGEL